MLSPTEVRDAIEALYEEDHAKLMKIAYMRARACFEQITENLVENLLHEALTKALDGQRKCPADTDFTAFLSNVMRSVASNWRKGRERHRTEQLPEDEEAEERLFLGTGRIESPEEGWMWRDELKRVLALFADDPVAHRVVILRSKGYRGTELGGAVGISPRELATVQRRIRRRWERPQTEGTP